MNSNALVAVLPTALIVSSLVIMASRTLAPFRATPEGRLEYELRLGFVQRALSQKANILSICALVALGGGVLGNTPWVSGGLGFIALAVMVGLLMVPQRVVFTSAGVMPSRAIFRPWKDFDNYQLRGRQVTLFGKARLSSTRLFASSKTSEEVERIVARHLKRSTAQVAPPARRTGNARKHSRRARPQRAGGR